MCLLSFDHYTKVKNEKNADLFDMISAFQRDVLANKPPTTQMYDEIRMMRFKIRPVNGKIAQLDFKNEQFIEMLWSLGKMDDFFKSNIHQFNDHERHTFFRLFDDMHRRFQSKFKKLALKDQNPQKKNHTAFELEIFKERSGKQN